MLLLVGDIAGVSGAALLLGETTFNALAQATSAAVAAITLGAIGSETKRQAQGRARAAQYDDLDKSYQPFRPLFVGRTDADPVVRNVVALAGFGLVLITIAIFALRTATEGAAAAWCFALIAAAVGLASFVNSYTTTCDVGEFLDGLKSSRNESRVYLSGCQSDPIISEHVGALAASSSHREVWTARGRAAWWGRQREKFAILNANPRTVGNGETAQAHGNHLGTIEGEDAA